MDRKKNPKADLESKRGIFTQIGLVLSLTIILVAFEWKTYDQVLMELGESEVMHIEEEEIPITRQETPPPPAPPTPTTILNIVDDDVEIEQELDIDAEATETTEIVEYVPIVVEEEAVVEAEIFLVVEDPATFPGGEPARMRFLQENIRYPQIAREMGIQGTAYVTFVVEPNGSLTNIRVLRGIGGGCDEEAIRVVSIMPRWVPGKQRGQAVRVQFNMPIRFVLQ
ncbi:MAG: energy transducer TonB [Bacteroidales bacterium]|nr:energy transducer TonB [Bacteroidales bacterium]